MGTHSKSLGKPNYNFCEKMASEKEQQNISTFVFLHHNTTCQPKHGECRVTEVCLLAVNKNDLQYSEGTKSELPRITNKLTLCFNPEREILQKATKGSRLTNEDLIHQKTFTLETASQIKSFLKHLEKPVCLVANYGKGFDFPVLKNELIRVNKKKMFDGIFCVDSRDILISLNATKTKVGVDVASASSSKRKSSHIPDRDVRPRLKKSKTGPVASKQTTGNQGHSQASPGLKKSQSFPAQSTSDDTPFALRIYYRNMFGEEPEQSHTAEGYCKALVEIAQATPRFLKK